MGRTQGGNNNAYCQDNETSWVDWSAPDDELIDFVASVTGLRRRAGAFSRRWDLHGTPDLDWYRPDGAAMTGEDWEHPYARSVSVAAKAQDGRTAVVLMINGWWEPLEFRVPVDGSWTVALDTARRASGSVAEVTLEGRSLVVLEAA
jgi:glycogen operon protein